MSKWKFDKDVADRFQKEAKTNIPDYNRVIKLCIDIAKKKKLQNELIIDVGSALGYTIHKFVKSGFKCTIGVDSSIDMINSNYNLHRERIIHSDKFPSQHKYGMVLANWTLHFIENRAEYIKDIYDALNDNGVLVLTDKTSQSETIKDLYYDFKRSNGVSDEYIYKKEQSLQGYMITKDVGWYLKTLQEIGFCNVQIINSNCGFTTFYAEK